MGKLVDKLERLQRASAPRLGFGPALPARQLGVALIAVLPAVDAKAAAAAVKAGADALLVQSIGKTPQGSLAQALGVQETVPCGATLNGAGRDIPSCDFVVAGMVDPAGPLSEADSLDRLLRLDGETPDPLLRALEALPIDGVVVPETAGPLTFAELARIYRVTRGTSKFVMAAVGATTDRATLRALRDSGIAGVMVEADAQALAALRKTLDELPAKKKAPVARGRSSVALGAPPSPEPAPVRVAPDGPDEPGPDDE